MQDKRNYELQDRIESDFAYHPPKPGQAERCESLRGAAKNLALRIAAEVPESREMSLALTHLEQAVMWANAGIARNE